MSFPDNWPKDCPPSQALTCNGSYLHIIKQNPPGIDDCRTFHEKGGVLRSPPRCPCMPFGLSVFTDREDVLHMRRTMPKLGKWIVTFTLTEPDGLVMLTPGQRPTHHTWWPSIECDRPSRITLTEEVA
jgi:hypothetical protein